MPSNLSPPPHTPRRDRTETRDRSAWARLIAKVYEIAPLACLRCGSEMNLIAHITDPPQIAEILRSLAAGRAPTGLDPNSLA
jgi:hypothetical protein